MTIYKRLSPAAFAAVMLVAAATSSARLEAQAPPAVPPSGAPPSGGTVLFSGAPGRSHAPAGSRVTVPVTDAMRRALSFTRYDLDVHLTPSEPTTLAVQARLTVRNDGDAVLTAIPLQLSSSLHFDAISVAGKAAAFAQQTLDSDADHTGTVTEAAIPLAQSLLPGTIVELVLAYSGSVPPSTGRLAKMHTPLEVARAADWDRISDEFVGLRGFGDVLWYPVAAPPVSMAEGATLFAEIGRQKRQNQDATVSMQVTEEFTAAAPNLAVLDGEVSELGAPAVQPTSTFPGVLRFALPPGRLGFRTLSLFVARRERVPSAGTLRVYAVAGNEASAESYLSGASLVEPLLTGWLGAMPIVRPALVDLGPALAGAGRTEAGDVVFEPLEPQQPSRLADGLSIDFAHGWFHSPRPWLGEGVPSFMGVLWTERTAGSERALEQLASVRGALALAEPADPSRGGGESLIDASDSVFYRVKATYVLWMLRAMVGDKALGAALRAYNPASDTAPGYFEQLVEKAAASDASGGTVDLGWFFRDWVYHDQGLPDLAITGVFPSRGTQPDQWLVSVDLSNDGYCEAEVPVSVRSATNTVTERLRIPARTRLSHRFLLTGEPTEVDLNDGSVPEIESSVHKRLLKDDGRPAGGGPG